MKKSKTIRWVTLASFCLLLTSFILYRAGYLDTYIFSEQVDMQPSLNMAANSTIRADTVPPKTTLPSSKSIIIVNEDHPAFKRRDSLARLDSTINSLERRLEIMSSSKSGAIFTPGGKYDSVKKALNSLKKQRKKLLKGN